METKATLTSLFIAKELPHSMASPVEIDHNHRLIRRETMDTLAARQQMVDQQIRTWEVLDRVCSMRSRRSARSVRAAQVPRARFRGCAAAIVVAEHAGPQIQGRILQALESTRVIARSNRHGTAI